jgi:molecular chaperone GrpE
MPEVQVSELQADVTELEAQLSDAEARAARREEDWRRALADFDNLRKRCARQTAEARADERASVAAQWLPVVDNIELALAHAQANPEAIMDGVRAVRDQAVDTLDRLGFRRLAEVGVPFDPARHEAVATARGSDTPPGTVVSVVRPGYEGGGHQLRPAAVVVATKDE